MELTDILSKDEARALAKARERFKKLEGDLRKEAPKLDKADFARAGSKKSLDLISANLVDDFSRFWALVREANNLYAAVKKGMNLKKSTHEFITLKALDLLGVADPSVRNSLQKACMGPDTDTDLKRLVFEGHFYGKVGGRRNGNFLERVFGDLATGLLGLVDRHVNDIDETAMSNLSKYYIHATEGNINLRELGWAAHYIQDLTAPHHAGNMAIGFETITDNCETHFPFEKYANGYVYENDTAFQGKAEQVYSEFSATFKPGRPEDMAREVHRRALPNIPRVQIIDETEWKQAIHDAIPVAIGATAVLLEPLKPVKTAPKRPAAGRKQRSAHGTTRN